MRALVLCNDFHHPAIIVHEGLAGLGDCGYDFDWVEDAGGWSADAMAGYPLVIFARANHTSASNMTPWATAEVGEAFVDHVAGGGGLLVLHSGTAGYDQVASLQRLVGGTFITHPAQCPVTVAPLAGHALTAGSAPFTLRDEHYHMEMVDPEVDLFLQASSEHGTQPAGWTRTEGAGRICVLTPGHNLEVWLHGSYQALLRNGMDWCTRQ